MNEHQEKKEDRSAEGQAGQAGSPTPSHKAIARANREYKKAGSNGKVEGKKPLEVLKTKDRGEVFQHPAEAYKEIWRRAQKRKALISEEVNRRQFLDT